MAERNNAFGQPVRALCFRQEDDEALARGYPHLIELTDEPLDAKKAQKLAAKAAHDDRLATTKLRVRFPRAASSHFVRGARAKEFQSWTRTGGPAPESAFADGSAVSPDEAHELVALSVKVAGCSSNPNHRAFYYVLEALVGTEIVAAAILDALEAMPDKRLTHEPGGPDRKTAFAVCALGMMLVRVPAGARAAQTKRLRALLGRAHAASNKAKSTGWEIVGALERVLDGWGAPSLAQADGYKYASEYVFATNDLDRLRTALADPEMILDYGLLDVRFVYLLGPDIVASLGKRRPLKQVVSTMFEDLGMIRHPLVATLFLEYVGKPMAKDMPLQWFRAHSDWARPILDAMRKPQAAAILRSLRS
jgi:hypothetical protein